KVIRCDNGTEFKNRVMNQFCEMKGIKREFSVARTPQQNGAEAVNATCYVQNRVLVIKPHNKTPDELFLGRKHALSFMRPFRYPITILYTIDHLGKFDGKADEGFFVGYSTNSKAFRVFNSRTRIVEENLYVQFSENTHNIARNGPNWLFDIDALTKSMNYKPVVAENQCNGKAGTKACDDAGKARLETVPGKDYILLPLWTQDLPFSSSSKDYLDAGFKPSGEEEKKDAEDLGNEDSEVSSTKEPRVHQEKDANVNNTNTINIVSPTVNAAGIRGVIGLCCRVIGLIEEEVYVCQPPGFEDPNFPDRVYKVEKALYGLHQAPRAWYETLSTYLLDNGFQKGKIDKTLFIKMVNVIFMMHMKFQMSSMGELTFFLGLQVKQKEDEIFISHDKYTEIHSDNESTIAIVKNSGFSLKDKAH
ncbi:ribonuclease H-like domain-containing protein, partial [Tanacetum coccineum]